MDIDALFSEDTGTLPASRAPAPLEDANAPTADISPIVAFSVALGMHTTEEICERHGITRAQYDGMARTATFGKLVETYATALQEQGLTFRTKAAVQAELMLDDMIWKLVRDPTVPSQVKLDAFKTVAKLAGYEPKQGAGESSSQSFKLVINLGDNDSRVIESAPILIGEVS